MADDETSKLHKDRNKILMQYAEQSFTDALDEINASLESEKIIVKSLLYYQQKAGFCETNFTLPYMIPTFIR